MKIKIFFRSHFFSSWTVKLLFVVFGRLSYSFFTDVKSKVSVHAVYFNKGGHHGVKKVSVYQYIVRTNQNEIRKLIFEFICYLFFSATITNELSPTTGIATAFIIKINPFLLFSFIYRFFSNDEMIFTIKLERILSFCWKQRHSAL